MAKSKVSAKPATKRARAAAKAPGTGAGRAAKSAARGGRREGRVRKEFWLTPGKLDEARRVLGTDTEVETVEEALDLVVFRDQVREGVRGLGGLGLRRMD